MDENINMHLQSHKNKCNNNKYKIKQIKMIKTINDTNKYLIYNKFKYYMYLIC